MTGILGVDEDNCQPGLSPQPIDIATPSVVDLARRLVGATRASLLLPLAGSGDLYIAEASGLPGGVVTPIRVRLGDPIAGRVAQTGQPSLSNAPSPRPGRPGMGYRTGSFISVPILSEEGPNGVFNVADPINGGHFSVDDLGALQALARYVARDLAGALAQRRLIRSQEEERRRIAMNLHDDVGHTLTTAIFRIDRDSAQLPGGESQARDALERARAQLLECADALHDIARELRPQTLEDLGLIAALRSLVGRVPESGGPPVTMATTGHVVSLDKHTELVLYRVAQEALMNIRKHARATNAAVLLGYGADSVMLVVEDNGIGLGHRHMGTFSKGGLGISGMRERVETLGGRFRVDSRVPCGTRASAWLPLPARER